MKCVAKLTTDDPGGRILCDADTDHIYQGSSLCVLHVVEAYERTELESGLGGLFKGLEKITLEEVAKVSAMMRPLMDAFSSSTSRIVASTPAICTKTDGCLHLADHVGECTVR